MGAKFSSDTERKKESYVSHILMIGQVRITSMRTFCMCRGFMLDDYWRKAGNSHSIFVPKICPKTRYRILMTPGQIVSRMSGDTVLVQDAIGEKVRPFFKSNKEKMLFITFQPLLKLL
jgi:hypothetical protein